MSAIAAIINEFSAAWAPQVWKASWQGGVALLLILLCSHAMQSIPGHVRCWLWRLAFLKLMIAGAWIVPVELPLLPVSTQADAAKKPVTAPAFDRLIANTNSNLLNADPSPAESPEMSAIRRWASASALSGSSWLMIFWAVGVVLSLARLCKQWTEAGKAISSMALVTDQEVHVRLAEHCRQMRIGRRPELRVSQTSESPFLVGIFRPVIVVPPVALESGNTEMLTTALVHELAHLKRRDLLWNLLPALAEALFFFHPLVWLARREWLLAQEIAADELAVSVSRMSVARYARSLMELVMRCRRRAHSPHLVVTVSAAYSQLSRRMKAMQTFQKLATSRRIVARVAALTIAVLGILPWTLTVRRATAQTESVSPAKEKPILTKAATKPAAQPVDPRDAEALQQFDRDYEPAQEEVVRRITPPFPASRMAYYRIEHAKQAEHMPQGPSTMLFHWKNGKRKIVQSWFGDPQEGTDLKVLLPTLCRIGPEFLQGDERLLARRVLGDFNIRADASREAIVADLQRILAAEWKSPVILRLEQSEREVYVARGIFKLSEAAEQRGIVLIEGALVGTAHSVKEAIEHVHTKQAPRGDIELFLAWVAKSTGMPIVNEVEKGPESRIPFATILAKGVVGKVAPEPILKSVGNQTGLTFTKEKRKILTLKVHDAG